MRLCIAILALAVWPSTPVAAEPITAYWRLEPSRASGPVSADFATPFLEQRMLPVGLVRLVAPALPAGRDDPVAAGTFLYEVNDRGKKGYCTLKDRSAGARSMFIPALDRRPCFVDADGDGRFEASFSVFEAYTTLSPPQPRGSIDGASPMTEAVAYERASPEEFPAQMRVSYRLRGGETPRKTRLRITVERPGHSEYVDRRGIDTDDGYALGALGLVAVVKSVTDEGAELELRIPPELYVYALDNGTVAVPDLPAVGAR